MALITCPECQKKISNRAMSCPGCGMPLSAHSGSYSVTQTELEYPEDIIIEKVGLPLNFGIGSSSIGLTYEKNENDITNLPNGHCTLYICVNGISIQNTLFNKYDIHFTQIIDVCQFRVNDVIEDRSVIGRAILGGYYSDH